MPSQSACRYSGEYLQAVILWSILILPWGGKLGTMRGQMRGRTQNECWRNYVQSVQSTCSILQDFVPSNEQEAYQAMKNDHQIGIWTLDFVFTNVDKLAELHGAGLPRISDAQQAKP